MYIYYVCDFCFHNIQNIVYVRLLIYIYLLSILIFRSDLTTNKDKKKSRDKESRRGARIYICYTQFVGVSLNKENLIMKLDFDPERIVV